MTLVRSKRKDVARVPEDLEELKRLGQELDRAIEEFDVRTLILWNCFLFPTLSARLLPPFELKLFWRMCVRSRTTRYRGMR
jgi:hypothetical protein